MGEIEDFILNKYVTETEEIKQRPGCWNTLKVKILQVGGDEKEDKKEIGSYERNYRSLYDTFHPFKKDGKEFALYSPSYMYTRVMELPSCKDLGGEDSKNVEYKDHFCPVEYYVPFCRKAIHPLKVRGKKEEIEMWLKGDECFDKEYLETCSELGPIQYCDFGFVAGCCWGDDTSWKIQYLDLSEVEKGIIRRDERFGYLELPGKLSLKEAINTDVWEPGHNWISIIHEESFNIDACKKDFEEKLAGGKNDD